MSNTGKKRMIEAYFQERRAPKFLSGMFRTPTENFFEGESVELDVERSGEDIAIAIHDVSAGYNLNTADDYTNKEFKPTVFKESIALNSFDLLKRSPGSNPFESVEFRAELALRMMKRMKRVEEKIRRSIELMAAQVLTTGKLTLTDAAGADRYLLDFKPKTAHFPSASVAWDESGSVPLDNLLALANKIRDNGGLDPDEFIMGEASFEAFIKDENVLKRFDTRRIDLGSINAMQKKDSGGNYRGTIEIGNYRYDIWTYGGKYTAPTNGASTFFVPTDKVIVRASSGRLDACFGNIPNIGQLLGVGGQLLADMPRRFSSSGAGVDLHANVWLSDNGEQLVGGVGSRPLLIPTAIDTFGCLSTGV
jgi:hypothetical protein